MLYTCIHMAIASFMTPFKAYKISSLHGLRLLFFPAHLCLWHIKSKLAVRRLLVTVEWSRSTNVCCTVCSCLISTMESSLSKMALESKETNVDEMMRSNHIKSNRWAWALKFPSHPNCSRNCTCTNLYSCFITSVNHLSTFSTSWPSVRLCPWRFLELNHSSPFGVEQLVAIGGCWSGDVWVATRWRLRAGLNSGAKLCQILPTSRQSANVSTAATLDHCRVLWHPHFETISTSF